jgi:hypothetical protein
LEDIYYRSQKNGCQCTLVLEDAGRCIRGVRITSPPGTVAARQRTWAGARKVGGRA